MSDYMLAPGARLEVGPHGKLYETLGDMVPHRPMYEYGEGQYVYGAANESLGACCQGCAAGNASCGHKPLGLSIGSVTISTPLLLVGAGLAAYLLFFRKKRGSRARRRNPATFTKKGERMYRHIRRGYGKSRRAKEIAARTVYAAAKRGTKGLVRKRRRRR